MSSSDLILFHVFFVFFSIMNSTGENTFGLINGRNICHALKQDVNEETIPDVSEKVNIQLYYECLCGGCSEFDKHQLMPVVQKLHEFINIKTYPYGNARTVVKNGKYSFQCQHGPDECYGNKLHACALDIIKNQTQALFYNTCMMDGDQSNGNSDDMAADQCGSSMSVDSRPIKACAKSNKGSKLLKYYGEESKKANFHYVPYVLINGKESLSNHFMRDVCAAFRKPPPPCTEYVQ